MYDTKGINNLKLPFNCINTKNVYSLKETAVRKANPSNDEDICKCNKHYLQEETQKKNRQIIE